jgi:hypothetical protein
MCFSTSMSLGAGAALGVVGVLSLKRVRKPSQLAFAAIPLLFSIQQFSEAFVWLSLTNKQYEAWETMATNVFLFFAQALWPAWVPLSIGLFEKEAKPKKILAFLTGMGVLLAGYLTYCLLFYPVSALASAHHIAYSLDFPSQLINLSITLYVLSTIVPLFISSSKKIQLLGVAVLGSFVLTQLFYAYYFISVWCFFAAVVSGSILYLVTDMNKSIATDATIILNQVIK